MSGRASWEPIAGGLPPLTGDRVRVDSVAERDGFLAAYNATGNVAIQFEVGLLHGGSAPERLGGPTTEFMDVLMRAAGEFARENGPTHPGSLPRFPVPSSRYRGKLDVPIAVLAVEQGRRGLYAPPRVVTLDYATGEPYGVGEFPGFDPRDWPPRRLGDWPPGGIQGMPPARLAGMVARFSACATRLMDVWFGGDDYPQRADEAVEVLALLGILCLPEMLTAYKGLNAGYIAWLRDGDPRASNDLPPDTICR